MNDIKEILPFVALADNIQLSNKMFAYYLRKFATDRVYQIYQTAKKQQNPVAQEIYPQLESMIQKTEELTRHLDGQLHTNQNLTQILAYSDKIYMQACQEFRMMKITTELSQNFQTAWRFYEMINYFNTLGQEHNQRRMDAKNKSVEVFKALKSGNQPQQGNFSPPVQTPPPTFQQSQFPMYSQHKPQQQQFGKKRIDPQKIKAQTTAINQLQNAVSELQFNRVHYAKDSIRKALAMIQKYND